MPRGFVADPGKAGWLAGRLELCGINNKLESHRAESAERNAVSNELSVFALRQRINTARRAG